MDALASRVGSAVIGVLDMVDAGLVLPVWYGTFVDIFPQHEGKAGTHGSYNPVLLIRTANGRRWFAAGILKK